MADPLALLSEPQRAMAQQLVPRQPSAPKGEDAAGVCGGGNRRAANRGWGMGAGGGLECGG